VKSQEWRCPRCGIVKPRTTEYWYLRKTGQWTTPCKPCRNERSKRYFRENKEEVKRKRTEKKRKNEGLLTSMRERQGDGYKCLALDVLTLAVLAPDTTAEFWHSWEFELFCATGDVDPDYIRRGVREKGIKVE